MLRESHKSAMMLTLKSFQQEKQAEISHQMQELERAHQSEIEQLKNVIKVVKDECDIKLQSSLSIMTEMQRTLLNSEDEARVMTRDSTTRTQPWTWILNLNIHLTLMWTWP